MELLIIFSVFLEKGFNGSLISNLILRILIDSNKNKKLKFCIIFLIR
jgi:hypothetical protein